MKKTIFFVFGLMLLVGLASLISVMAYKGDPSVKGPNYNEEVHEQLEAAIEQGDYNAWIAIRRENNLPMNGRIFQAINAENFDKYKELHNAMQSGDYDRANTIRTELGLGQGMKKGTNRKNNGKMLGQRNQRASCIPN
ncbi:MAG: hypothetical protein QXK76_03595 [Candidatus Woesearchaeota archaeon]